MSLKILCKVGYSFFKVTQRSEDRSPFSKRAQMNLSFLKGLMIDPQHIIGLYSQQYDTHQSAEVSLASEYLHLPSFLVKAPVNRNGGKWF